MFRPTCYRQNERVGHIIDLFLSFFVNITVRDRDLTPSFGMAVRDRDHDSRFGSAACAGTVEFG
jgi:hypothetical protein